MTVEALRTRRKGQASFVDRMIDFAVGVANEHMVPDGLQASLWQTLSGHERFYLKMVGLEAEGLTKLDNYQNFSRAFRVGDYNPLMASVKPNAARLRGAEDFGTRTGFDIPDFGSGIIRATLFGIDGLIREVDPDVVLQQMRDLLPDYFKRRSDLVEVADYLARRRGPQAVEGRHAAILVNLMRNERL